MDPEAERERMVQEQLRGRGLDEERLLAAFLKVPRHLFVPEPFRAQAYADHPLPIGEGQTMSQPYIVALMTHLLRLQGHERVLEVGAGSGFQTAILAEMALEVCAVERLDSLLTTLKRTLDGQGYANVRYAIRDGSEGWPEMAPFDAILVGAGSPDVPKPLVDQLANGGRLVLPVGSRQSQELTLVEKRDHGVDVTRVTPCVFVPLVGRYAWPEQD